jgi:diguanylate cyclase (GGDEF)-like protein
VYAGHLRNARNTLVFAGLTLAAITLSILMLSKRALADIDRRQQLQRRYEEAHNRARTDPLTGVANRTAFDADLRAAHAVLAAGGAPFVLAFLDIDRFKKLNDERGHAIGDQALQRVAQILRDGVRGSDVVARLGGDEFAVLLPGSSALGMWRVFEPIHQRLLREASSENWPITFSIGVVAFESPPSRARDAIGFADRVMYDVKTHGRNGVRYGIYRAGALAPELYFERNAA